MSKTTLTSKQDAFVRHYLANGNNGVDAARQAGYKGNDNTLASVAKENLRKPHIAALIDVERDALKARTGATAEAKRALLWKIAQACAEHTEPSTPREEGDPSVIKMIDAKAAIAAVAELNKMDGDLAAIKTEQKVAVSHEDALSELE